MRVFGNILSLIAIAFMVSCEPVEQQPAEMEFKIISANPMVVAAEGGDFAIEYVITAPDETLDVVATKDADWIRLKESSGEESNKIYFAVEENEATQSRSTVITITYDREYKVIVNQAAFKEEPKELLSTLTRDVEMILDEDNSLVYADYYGEDYGDGRGMWQFWFLDVVEKQMLCIEILTDSQGNVATEQLYVPTGKYEATDDFNAYDVIVKGYRTSDIDGLYDGGSWYEELETADHGTAKAPIAEGVLNIELNADNTYDVTFELKDDVGNQITGTYVGAIIAEDFRKE